MGQAQESPTGDGLNKPGGDGRPACAILPSFPFRHVLKAGMPRIKKGG
jgi:hypothetical protein